MPSTNPYRYDNAEANTTANSIGPRDVYHREAHGLTGEMLDACLREQFTAGANVGAREAWDEAGRLMRESNALRWDEGYAAGRNAQSAQAADAFGRTSHAFGSVSKSIAASNMAAAKKAWLEDRLDEIRRAVQIAIRTSDE